MFEHQFGQLKGSRQRFKWQYSTWLEESVSTTTMIVVKAFKGEQSVSVYDHRRLGSLRYG